MKRLLSLTIPLCLGAFACGGASLPHDQLADAEAAVRAAEEVDANEYPTASAHLKFARDQIDQARAFMKEDDDEEYRAAERILERAELDAEVAVQRAKAEKKRDEAFEAQQKVRQLADDDSQALLQE